jgi:membrane protein
MIVKGYRLGPLLKKTAREVLDDNVLGLAAQMAYYFFFSLFPIFLFLAPMLALVGDKRETFAIVLDQLSRAVPAEAFALVKNVVQQVVFEPSAPGLVSVGALLALWSGSSVFMNLIGALNAAYDCDKDARPWWKRQLIAIAALLCVGLLFVTATVVMVAGGDIVDKGADALGIGTTGRVLWTVVQYALALAILVGTAWSIYMFLPDVKQSRWHALAGAVVATVLWIVVTMGFRMYVQNFGNYNKTYGTIGAVIVLLTWMYLSMIVLLTGGELAAELHHGTGALRTRVGHLYNGWISDGREVAKPSVGQVRRVAPGQPHHGEPAAV